MALAYAINEQYLFSNARAVLVTVTKPEEAYPAGGYDVNADKGKLGFAVIHAVVPLGSTSAGLMVNWDGANKKLRYWYPTQQTASQGNREGVEVSGTVAAHVVSALVLGV